MFPMIGNVGGPGGRFLGLLPILKRGKQQTATIARMTRSIDAMTDTIEAKQKEWYLETMRV
jgi:hypothetical protein